MVTVITILITSRIITGRIHKSAMLTERVSLRHMPATVKDTAMIAIVDDDESVCRALKRLVRSLGREADTFLSGQEFVDLIEAMPSFRVDCLVLDVQMPGVNGLEVQRRLVAGGSRLPIIFRSEDTPP